jgi:hypothetical protein
MLLNFKATKIQYKISPTTKSLPSSIVVGEDVTQYVQLPSTNPAMKKFNLMFKMLKFLKL